MNTAVNEALKRCFAEKRVVFWYDEGGKCRAEFDEAEIEGVEKLVIGGNEFGIKYILPQFGEVTSSAAVIAAMKEG